MAARLVTLRDNRVTALLLEPASLVHGCGGGQDLCARMPDASQKLPVRKTEVKADHLRLQFDHHVAHRCVKRHSGGTRSRRFGIESKLDVITRQALSPRLFPRGIRLRRLVAEEVEIDGSGGSLADDGQLGSNLAGVEHGAGERSEGSSLRYRDRQLRQCRSRHRGQNDRPVNAEQIENATIVPGAHSLQSKIALNASYAAGVLGTRS